jgi:hypothetical protein
VLTGSRTSHFACPATGRTAPVSTDSFLIFNLILLAVVLESDLGRRKISLFRVARPLVGATVIAPFFISAPGASAWGIGLQVIGVGAGLCLGWAAAALLPVAWDPLRQRPYSRGGPCYALLWAAVSAGRYLFSYGAQHWFGRSLSTFMITNHVSRGALADALIFLFLAMYLVRALSLAVRRQAVIRRATATSDRARQPVTECRYFP